METKSRILETAFKLFLKKGFAGVSLNEVIKASDITTGGFYYHFDSKEALMVAVIQKYIFNYFNSTIEQIRHFEGTPKEKLKSAALSMIGEDQTTQLVESTTKIDYRVLNLLLLEGVQKYDIISEHYTEFYYNLFKFNKDVIEDGISHGIIRTDVDLNELAMMTQTVLVGTIVMWVIMPTLPLEKTLRTNIDQLWDYMKK
ncbi:TetR/AcrR family transcriptional regulator [Methanobacterium formicicum]|uniref:TetR family transcriptional regulator n=1 Tax=Methanobacterium formicicum (strain DSM 3637 / PP1) TaxID=1204725 RepID=K2R4X9_METFP|nr:TetR/AcrR family transcriptional regulator [Methanobacterium formicicum]EKF86262.1 TetR family transcriptional regulator [Methanobacterium formicicum DSM 3637]